MESRPTARRRFVIADPIHLIYNLDLLHRTPTGDKGSLGRHVEEIDRQTEKCRPNTAYTVS